jgi:hypothetical protein
MAPVLLDSKVGSIDKLIGLSNQILCGVHRHCSSVINGAAQGP